MKRRSLLNVRSFLEYVILSCDSMTERAVKNEINGISLPPIDFRNLNEMRFFAKAILRKHESKKTRKDIYVEVF